MTKIVQSKRQVIENQLLTALDDKSKVALILNEKDITLILSALTYYRDIRDYSPNSLASTMIDDIQLLKDSAFPKGSK